MQLRRLILIYFYLCPIERLVTQKSRANRAAVTKAATTTKKTTLTRPSGNTCLRRGSSDGCRASRRQAYKDSPRPRSRSAREESEFEHRSLLVSLYLSSWPHRSHFRIFGSVNLIYGVHEYPLPLYVLMAKLVNRQFFADRNCLKIQNATTKMSASASQDATRCPF